MFSDVYIRKIDITKDSIMKRLFPLDFKTIKSFIAVVECKGVSAAQARLNLSQSVISGHLKQLEDNLDMTLCQRGRSGFALTDAGMEVYEACKNLMDAGNTFTHQLQYIHETHEFTDGRLSLAITDQAPKKFTTALHETIAEIYAEHDKFQISIRVQSPATMNQMIVAGECDLGVGYFGKMLPVLGYIPAFDETQCLCCGARHPLFKTAEPPLSELETDYPWVNRGYTTSSNLLPNVYPKKMNAIAYHMEATCHFILAGTHIGYLPEEYAERYIKTGEMRILHPRDASYKVRHHWVYKPEMTPIVSYFYRKIRDKISFV